MDRDKLILAARIAGKLYEIQVEPFLNAYGNYDEINEHLGQLLLDLDVAMEGCNEADKAINEIKSFLGLRNYGARPTKRKLAMIARLLADWLEHKPQQVSGGNPAHGGQ